MISRAINSFVTDNSVACYGYFTCHNEKLRRYKDIKGINDARNPKQQKEEIHKKINDSHAKHKRLVLPIYPENVHENKSNPRTISITRYTKLFQ